jgi:hypothetical protein
MLAELLEMHGFPSPKEMKCLAIHSRMVVQHLISYFIENGTIPGLIWISSSNDH